MGVQRATTALIPGNLQAGNCVNGRPAHRGEQGPLEAAQKRETSHDFAVDKEKLQQGLGSFYNTLKVNLNNTGSFIPWYKSYLGRILNRPITTLRIDKTWYRWTGGRMVLIHSENWING